MKTAIIAKVTADGKLEIPPEVLAQLQPSTEYEVSVTEDEIVFKRTYKRLTLEELRQRVLEAGSDPNQPRASQMCKNVFCHCERNEMERSNRNI